MPQHALAQVYYEGHNIGVELGLRSFSIRIPSQYPCTKESDFEIRKASLPKRLRHLDIVTTPGLHVEETEESYFFITDNAEILVTA